MIPDVTVSTVPTITIGGEKKQGSTETYRVYTTREITRKDTSISKKEVRQRRPKINFRNSRKRGSDKNTYLSTEEQLVPPTSDYRGLGSRTTGGIVETFYPQHSQ